MFLELTIKIYILKNVIFVHSLCCPTNMKSLELTICCIFIILKLMEGEQHELKVMSKYSFFLTYLGFTFHIKLIKFITNLKICCSFRIIEYTFFMSSIVSKPGYRPILYMLNR